MRVMCKPGSEGDLGGQPPRSTRPEARKSVDPEDHRDRLLQSLEQPLVVRLVLEDGSPAVATGHHVMDRAGIFDPQRSGHGPRLSHRFEAGKPKTGP